MEIAAFKDKSRIRPFRLECLELESLFDENLIFWIPESKPYQPINFQQKKSSYERDIIFLRQPINSVSRQVL